MKTGKQEGKQDGKQELDDIYGSVGSACLSRPYDKEPFATTHRDKGYVSLDNLMPNQRARRQLQLADGEIKACIIPLAKKRGIKFSETSRGEEMTGKQMLDIVYRVMSIEDHVIKKRDSRGSNLFRMLDEWCSDEANIMADRSEDIFVRKE